MLSAFQTLGPLLARGQLDGERAAEGVHLVTPGLSSHRGGGGRRPSRRAGRSPAAVFTVNEELSDLLGDRDVVDHDRQLGGVHGTLVCEEEAHQREVGINAGGGSGSQTKRRGFRPHLKSRHIVGRRCAEEETKAG